MVSEKRERGLSESLDRWGRAIVRAATANEEEAEAAASSQCLYTRLQARINAEREGRKEKENWLALVGVAGRAVPAMALVAICSFILFVSASLGTRTSVNFSDEAILGARGAEVEQIVFTGNQAPSRDEVLAAILSEDEQGASR
jgi:hypothetical protein